MKLIDKKFSETVYQLEVTERELNTLIASVGKASLMDVKEVASRYNKEILDIVKIGESYKKLKQIGGWEF